MVSLSYRSSNAPGVSTVEQHESEGYNECRAVTGATLSVSRSLPAHAMNNPARFRDPSGHRACGDGEIIDCDGRLTNPSKGERGCGGPGQPFCGGKHKDPQFQWGPQPDSPEHDSGLEGLGYWIQYGKVGIELIEWINNVGQPIYKQVRALGNLGPFWEGMAGGLLQAAQDSDDPLLSSGQKTRRTIIVGLEAAGTDAIAGPWAVWAGAEMAAAGGEAGAFAGPGGMAVGAIGAGLTAYVGTNFVITQFMDRVVWDTVNSELFPKVFP